MLSAEYTSKLASRTESLLAYFETEQEQVRFALDYATKAHSDQIRKSGEPYVTHPLEVAILVADLGGSLDMVLAALLHDVVEDTSIQLSTIEDIFGKNVSLLVEGCTKVSKVHPDSSNLEAQALTLRKLFVSLARDPRVVVIKVCDRLHNMRTIDYLPEKKQIRIGKETLAIHAPLAGRLGLGVLKSELEDRAFKAVYPHEYAVIDEWINKDGLLYAKLNKARDILEETLRSEDLSECIVSGRIKHRWSVYKKFKKADTKYEDIYDLLGLRIVVNSDAECYYALSVVNSLWKPVATRYKDYISKPKYNSYRSIHTTVLGPDDSFIEIQIRTKKHHADAEHGAAAHHMYKHDDDKSEWLKRLLRWDSDTQNSEEYLHGVHQELSKESEVVVYSPSMEMFTLAKGSSTIDFAYAVHTDVGNSCISAQVNGALVPLRHKLESGDVVTITTGSRNGPSVEWLDWTVTSKARSKIKQYTKVNIDSPERKNSELVLRKWADSNGIDANNSSAMQEVIATLHMASLDDLLRAIGSNKYTLPVYAPRPLTIRKEIEENHVLRAVDLGLLDVTKAGCCLNVSDLLYSGVVGKRSVVAHGSTCARGIGVLKKDPGRSIRVYSVAPTHQVEGIELKVSPRDALYYDIAKQVLSVGGVLVAQPVTIRNMFVGIDVSIRPSRSKDLRGALSLIGDIRVL